MAVDMFIKIGDLKGESGDSKHAGEIDVLAWSWGLSNSGDTHVGGGGGAGKVNVQDFSFTKWMDKSTPNLIQYGCSGKHFPSAELVVRKAGDKPLEYWRMTFTDVLITSVSTGGSGGAPQARVVHPFVASLNTHDGRGARNPAALIDVVSHGPEPSQNVGAEAALFDPNRIW